MSYTRTMTVTAPPSICQHFDELLAIFDRHEPTVPLYDEVVGWAEDIVTNYGGKTITREIEEQVLPARVDFLKNKILVDSLYGKPLVTPVMDREWVFEESFLTKFKKQCPISPFDFKPIIAKPHKFAQEVLNWIRSLPSNKDFAESKMDGRTHQTSSSTLLVKIVPFTELDLLGIFNLAQQHIKTAQRRKEREEAALETEKLVLLEQRINQRVEQDMQKLKENFAEREGKVQSQIDEVMQTSQATIGVLYERNDTLSQKNQELGADLKETKQTVTTLKGDVSRLHQRIRDLENQVNNRPKDGGKKCLIQ